VSGALDPLEPQSLVITIFGRQSIVDAIRPRGVSVQISVKRFPRMPRQLRVAA